MKHAITLIFITVFAISRLCAQPDSTKPEPGQFFADIHFFAQTDLNKNLIPASSFGVNTAIMGYKRTFSKSVTGTILYDVTRTTNFVYPDSIGIASYFEGSKYTAFLKMAEIDWKIKPWAELGLGQLLNEQYLTVQDKHWGFRYVNTTMQEYFRFGNPADFGIRMKFYPVKKLMVSATVMNGEGPFRYQDSESLFQYCLNIEYRPKEHLIIKVYGDYQPHATGLIKDRSAISLFSGYKKDTWMAGAEYNLILNNAYVEGSDLNGFSLYGSHKTGEKTTAFARADYLFEFGATKNEMYWMAGVEYHPVQALGLAIYVKRNTWLNTTIIGMNAGMRF